MRKKILSCIMAFTMVFTALGVFAERSAAITPVSTDPEKIYAPGAVARYDGNENQRTGHSLNATTWHDLSGNGYDIDISGKTSSYFTNYAFVLDGEAFALNNALTDVINSDEYTVEVALGDLERLGNTFSTFINSIGNDNFSLFIRSNVNVLEFKANGQDSKQYPRPITAVPEGREYSTYHTLAVTFKKNVVAKIYVDGIEVASSTAVAGFNSGAVGPIAIGSAQDIKKIKAEYRGVRIYDRVLSTSELASNASTDKITYITDSSKAIPLTVGVPYPVSNIYSFTLSPTVYKRGGYCNINSLDDSITITNGYITATKSGVYDMTMYDGEKAVPLKAVVKNPGDIDHVIFSDQFTGTMKDGYRYPASNRFSHEANHLVVDGGGVDFTRFFLPEYVDFFGDYNIVANVIFQAVENDRRWMSITFRGNANAAPYYQMCVRQKTTYEDGIEFARRNDTDTDWDVLSKTAHDINMNIGENFQIRLKTSGNLLREFLQTKLRIEAVMPEGANTGSVGFTVNRSIVKFDNITVSLNCSRAPSIGYTDVAQPDTNIIGGLTMTERLENAEDLAEIAAMTVKPANAIMYVDADLNIYDRNFTESFGTIQDGIAALDNCIMPTFYVRDNASVDAVAAYLAALSYTDVFFMSPTDSVLVYAKERYYLARRVLDFTPELSYTYAALGFEKITELRARAHKAWASTVVLPSNCTNYEVLTAFQDMVMTVWLEETNPLTSKTKAFDLLAQGPYGIISDNTELIYDVTQNVMGQNTMLRSPLNVGHRGTNTLPDNTLEGCIQAVKDGAEVLELDIWITTDGHIVCCHDGQTSGFNQVIAIESNNLNTVKSVYVGSSIGNLRVPTLREIFAQFKGTPTRYFIEIKSYKTNIVGALKALTEEMGVFHQVSVITFERTGQLPIMRSQWPEMSVGCLIDANVVPVGSTSEQTVQNVAPRVQSYGSTFNPGKALITDDYIRSSNIRGITINPWTFDNNIADHDRFILNGAASLTTNTPYLIKSYNKKIVWNGVPTSYTVKMRDSHQVREAVSARYDGGLENVSTYSPIVIIEGSDIVNVGANNVLTFNKPGTVTYAATYTQYMGSGASYTLYTQPITITVLPDAEIGDINGDGIINTKDIVALKMYLNDNTYPIEVYAADVNADGAINAEDANAIAAKIAAM